MFIKSLKYLALAVCGITLIYFIFSDTPETDDVLFDIDYVLDLLDSNKALEQQVSELDERNAFYIESVDNYKREISIVNSTFKSAVADLASCDKKIDSLVALSEAQAAQRKKTKAHSNILNNNAATIS
jgi:hypothetical protein